MHNLSDDELDRLSREAAEQHRIPADASMWEKIATVLDREMPSGPGFNYHVIPDLALLLLLIIGVPVFYSVPAKQPAIYIQQELKTNSGTAENSLAVSESGSSDNQNSDKLKSEKRSDTEHGTGEPGIEKVPAENSISVLPTRKVSSGSGADKVLTEKKPHETAGVQSDKTRTTRENETSAGKTGPVDKDQMTSTVASIHTKSNIRSNVWELATLEESLNIHDINTISGPSTLVVSDPFPKPADVKKTESPVSANAAKNKGKNDPAAQNSSLLEFGLTWGPDFSKVGSAPAGNVGNIYGFVAAFNINKRWSINSGILYSNKNYTAMGDEYEKIPGYNPADPDIKIKKVMAECLMWDLPINVRYNWYWRPKQRAFTSTGLSSYFMKEEDLKYWYTYYNNPKYKEWVNTNSSNYWFAVLNLSAGFEQQLFEGVTVQAEPFLKLSLRDVGYGKVNLKSWGVFLGLKYIPPIHRIKK